MSSIEDSAVADSQKDDLKSSSFRNIEIGKKKSKMRFDLMKLKIWDIETDTSDIGT